MKNGFIYPIVNSIIQLLYYFNLVELFKFVARKIAIQFTKKRNKNNPKLLIASSNIAIDVFQVFKWGVLLVFWANGLKNELTFFVVYYLIYSNLFTYFYYHTWGSKFRQRSDRETLNRKYLNTLFAISFYIFSYAYLFHIHYPYKLLWPDHSINAVNAIYLSFTNAFTLSYGEFEPLTQSMRMVLMEELIITVIFLTIIITNSIPDHTKGDSK